MLDERALRLAGSRLDVETIGVVVFLQSTHTRFMTFLRDAQCLIVAETTTRNKQKLTRGCSSNQASHGAAHTNTSSTHAAGASTAHHPAQRHTI